MNPVDVELQNIGKQIGSLKIIENLSLAIERGSFISILGPSGCGKTTTLNLIAGFDNPTHGRILIRGIDQTSVPPEKRHVGLVFQNYALFPHMTVAQNVGFGLRMQRKSRLDIDGGVREALRSVCMEGFEDRYPKELSGGQQQRVAIARALAPRPSVLLLDEPLSNLDLKLREAMRIELKEIQQKLGMTFVYVTHDQEEALAMSDRVIIMNKGQIVQSDVPAAIYADPRSAFVADFIGKSNLLSLASVTRSDAGSGVWRLSVSETETLLSAKAGDGALDARFASIRPEEIRLCKSPGKGARELNALSGRVKRMINMGASVDVWFEGEDGLELVCAVRPDVASQLRPGEQVAACIGFESIRLLTA